MFDIIYYIVESIALLILAVGAMFMVGYTIEFIYEFFKWLGKVLD